MRQNQRRVTTPVTSFTKGGSLFQTALGQPNHVPAFLYVLRLRAGFGEDHQDIASELWVAIPLNPAKAIFKVGNSLQRLFLAHEQNALANPYGRHQLHILEFICDCIGCLICGTCLLVAHHIARNASTELINQTELCHSSLMPRFSSHFLFEMGYFFLDAL